MGHNSIWDKTQNLTELKNSKCDKTQKIKMWQLKTSRYDKTQNMKTQKLKMWQNWTTEDVTNFQTSKCYETPNLKLCQN